MTKLTDSPFGVPFLGVERLSIQRRTHLEICVGRRGKGGLNIVKLKMSSLKDPGRSYVHASVW